MSFDYSVILAIVTDEFSDIVVRVEHLNENLRVHLKDSTFVDVWFSVRSKEQRFAFHWERREKDGSIYRHNNIPDRKWSFLKSFPKHFHAGSESNVQESILSDDPTMAFRQFLEFVREWLRSNAK